MGTVLTQEQKEARAEHIKAQWYMSKQWPYIGMAIGVVIGLLVVFIPLYLS